MTFPKYPEYKDSGVEWLGEVPAHWEVTKLSYITNRIGSGKTPSGGATAYVSSGVPFIRSQNVHDQGLRLDDIVYIDEATDREMAWSRVRPLDVLINITGASIGRSCQVPAGFGIANVNQHVCVIRLDKPDEASGWVAWAMKAPATKEQVKVSQTGAAREGLNFEQLAGFYLCMPTLTERRTISAFLDHETARIDALVEEQQRLVELLKEKRQAVISHAVTKGLDPDVPMKDSGVEWLGEVPAHWEVSRLKRLASLISKGTTPTTVGAEFVDDGIRFLKAENVGNGHVQPEPLFFIDEASDRLLARSRLQVGDVLVVIAGATTGRAAVVREADVPSNTNQAVSFIRLNSPDTANFVTHWIQSESVQRLIRLDAVQAAQPNLAMEDLGNIEIAVPPSEELESLCGYIAEFESGFQLATTAAMELIDRLQERRSALISAAVTGKIDVRGWQPPVGSSAPAEVSQTEAV